MGVCCDNLGVKKLKIKVKRKKKRKTKDAKEEMSFNITDVNQNKSNQIFTKTNLTLRELLTLAEFNLNGDFDIQLENSENRSFYEYISDHFERILYTSIVGGLFLLLLEYYSILKKRLIAQ